MGDRLSSLLRPGTTGKAPELVDGRPKSSFTSSCCRRTSAASSGRTRSGAASGTSTPKPSPPLRPYGVPGSTCASTRQPGWSVWWRYHADHHLGVLLNRQGPFLNCDMKEHRDLEHLEPKMAPAGWFLMMFGCRDRSLAVGQFCKQQLKLICPQTSSIWAPSVPPNESLPVGFRMSGYVNTRYYQTLTSANPLPAINS
jgi:hypothetical protein